MFMLVFLFIMVYVSSQL